MVELASFRPGVPAPQEGVRRALLAKVHIAAKAIGMSDDGYRAMLDRVAGVASAKDCSIDQLRAVVGELQSLGFVDGAPPRSSGRANNPIANKARAMWISLYQLAAIADPSEEGLEMFARRQLGVDRLHWIDQRKGDALIEALKGMAEREGWDQRVSTRQPVEQRIRILKERLVGAQLAKLDRLGAPASGPITEDRSRWPTGKLESAARELGTLLREATAG